MKDRESALLAVRWAGLPVFLLGIGTTMLGAVGALSVLGDQLEVFVLTVNGLVACVGLAFIALGLRLQKRQWSLTPFAVIFSVLWMSVALWLLPKWWVTAILAVMLLVIVSGLRGWWWLRQNPA